jgi:hypothetical protein
MDYYAHATGTSAILERLAGLRPAMLACQHGSAYRGDGAALLRELANKIATQNARRAQQPDALNGDSQPRATGLSAKGDVPTWR